MKRTLRLMITAIVALIVVATATVNVASAAIISVTVVPSLAPNSFTSPSWTSYKANAITSLTSSLGTTGSRLTSPVSYEVAPAIIGSNEVIVSPFNSWRGIAPPTGAFSGEFGNRLLGGVLIASTGNNTFTLSQMFENVVSTDVSNALSTSISFASANYTSTVVGYTLGVDGIAGTGDDQTLNSGQVGTTPVWKIAFVGLGNAYDATGAVGATDQDKLNNTEA